VNLIWFVRRNPSGLRRHPSIRSSTTLRPLCWDKRLTYFSWIIAALSKLSLNERERKHCKLFFQVASKIQIVKDERLSTCQLLILRLFGAFLHSQRESDDHLYGNERNQSLEKPGDF